MFFFSLSLPFVWLKMPIVLAYHFPLHLCRSLHLSTFCYESSIVHNKLKIMELFLAIFPYATGGIKVKLINLFLKAVWYSRLPSIKSIFTTFADSFLALFWAAALQGDKSCGMGKKSIYLLFIPFRPSGRSCGGPLDPSGRPSGPSGWPSGLCCRPSDPLIGPQTPLPGTQTPLAGPQTP